MKYTYNIYTYIMCDIYVYIYIYLSTVNLVEPIKCLTSLFIG